jgi:hypothetical protein
MIYYRVCIDVLRYHRLHLEEHTLWAPTLDNAEEQLKDYLKGTNNTVFSEIYERVPSSEYAGYEWRLIRQTEHNKFD